MLEDRSAKKSGQGKQAAKYKKKVSDYNLEVGLGKRMDPEYEGGKQPRIDHKKVLIKMDSVRQLAQSLQKRITK